MSPSSCSRRLPVASAPSHRAALRHRHPGTWRRTARAALNRFYQVVGAACGTEPGLVGARRFAAEFKKSDTLFVLAAGSSITGFTENDFAVIRRHDSIALSSFIVHDLVPSWWLVETHPPSLGLIEHVASTGKLPKQPVLYKGYNGPTKLVHTIANLRALASGSHIYLMKDAYTQDLGRTAGLPTAVTRSEDDFFYGHIGSITYCLGLAYKTGYENVVLCGADSSQDYFYHRGDEASAVRSLPRFMTAVNLIAADEAVLDSMLATVAEMDRLFREERGGRVYSLKCLGPLGAMLADYETPKC